jgi:hypothetical protein
MNKNNNNKPVHEVKIGLLRGTVWANRQESGRTFYNCTFSRLFKDVTGDWRDTGSFNRDDLLIIAKLADLVHSWITQQGDAQNEDYQMSSTKEVSLPL